MQRVDAERARLARQGLELRRAERARQLQRVIARGQTPRQKAIVSASLDGFAIVDIETGKPYLDIGFTSELAAERERACLLRGFPPDHAWSKRLCVLPVV